MSADCDYPNPCDCGCHYPETGVRDRDAERGSWRAEAMALRARIAAAEKDNAWLREALRRALRTNSEAAEKLLAYVERLETALGRSRKLLSDAVASSCVKWPEWEDAAVALLAEWPGKEEKP